MNEPIVTDIVPQNLRNAILVYIGIIRRLKFLYYEFLEPIYTGEICSIVFYQVSSISYYKPVVTVPSYISNLCWKVCVNTLNRINIMDENPTNYYKDYKYE